jgi:hypothetical protein
MPREAEVRTAVGQTRAAAEELLRALTAIEMGIATAPDADLSTAQVAAAGRRLADAAQPLAARLAALRTLLGGSDQPGGADALPALPDASATADKPPPTTFAAFLDQIGRAMVDAQQGLDTLSNLYSHGPAPLVAPTSYRIPKLTASMRFALETVREREFNLLVYSDTQRARELNQQTLDLEIVAVPAAPEVAAAIAERRPRFTVVTGAAARAALLEALLAGLAGEAAAAAVRAAPARTVFAAGPPRGPGPTEDILALFTTPDPDGPAVGSAGAWYMTVEAGKPRPHAAALVPFGAAPEGTAPQRLLHNLADELCRMQAALG